MAGPHLGYIGRHAYHSSGDKLFTAEDILCYLQVWDRNHDAGFLSFPYLAPYRGLEDIWFSLCQGSLHHDLYVLPAGI